MIYLFNIFKIKFLFYINIFYEGTTGYIKLSLYLQQLKKNPFCLKNRNNKKCPLQKLEEGLCRGAVPMQNPALSKQSSMAVPSSVWKTTTIPKIYVGSSPKYLASGYKYSLFLTSHLKP